MIGVVVTTDSVADLLRKALDLDKAYVFSIGSVVGGRQFDEILVLGPADVLSDDPSDPIIQWLESLRCRLKPGGKLIYI